MSNSKSLPLTYTDLVILDSGDMDPMASETTSDFQNLTQDVMHILQENLGSNLDDPNRGVGVQNYLSGTVENLAAMTKTIDAQLTTDPRIDNSKTTITANAPDSTFPYNIVVLISADQNVLPLTFQWGPNQGIVFTP